MEDVQLVHGGDVLQTVDEGSRRDSTGLATGCLGRVWVVVSVTCPG